MAGGENRSGIQVYYRVTRGGVEKGRPRPTLLIATLEMTV